MPTAAVRGEFLQSTFGAHGLQLEARCAPELAMVAAAFAPGVQTRGAADSLSLDFLVGQARPAPTASLAWTEDSDADMVARQYDRPGHAYWDQWVSTRYDLSGRRGRVTVEDPAGWPSWLRAAPGLRIIDWWATQHGCLAMHASAIRIGDSAIVCCAPSGSGKSTLSVEAAMLGHGFLGDDYVLVEPGSVGTPTLVHAIYRSAKLLPSRRVPGLDMTPWMAAGKDSDKDILLMPEHRCCGSAPVAALVVPRVTNADAPTIRPLSRAVLIRQVISSILRQIHGLGAEKLATLSRITSLVPCFEMDLARDGAANVGALEMLINDLGETS